MCPATTHDQVSLYMDQVVLSQSRGRVPSEDMVSQQARSILPVTLGATSAEAGPIVAQQTQNICITFIQCWTNVEDVGPTLYKCFTNVLCLLGN